MSEKIRVLIAEPLSPRAEAFAANRTAMNEAIATVEAAANRAMAGGGEFTVRTGCRGRGFRAEFP